MSSPRDSSHASASCAGVLPFVSRQLLDLVHEVEILLKVLALEAWVVAPPVVGGKVVDRAIAAGQKAAAERAIGDERDAELAAGVEQLAFRIAAPQRVLGLQRRNRMDGVRLCESSRARPPTGRGGEPCRP